MKNKGKLFLGTLLLGGIVYIIGFCTGASWIFKRNFEFTKKQCERGDKFFRMFGVLNYWLRLKEDNKSVISYLTEMNYNNIAIYGLGHLGTHLVKELQKSEISIDYAIDKNVEEFAENIVIYKPDDLLPATDVIIVTAIMEFESIADKLAEKMDCPIISLEDVIYAN